jgi:sodium transport system ATP-binding protein
VIRTTGLTKVFAGNRAEGVKAVDNVSFSCEAGIVYGLLGPNGAGKTTTLRILSTALKPTSGTALVNGVDVTADPQEVRMQIGFLSGTTGLYGRLSPREMVTYFGRLYGMPKDKIDRRIEEIFEMLDMKEFAGTRNDNLSTGMKQKASIARSVIHDPPVMIFDEPTTGLDVMSSRTIVKFIRHCADQGKTVIFSTHIMSEAARLCERIGIIHRGRLYAEGTPGDLLNETGMNNLEDAFVKIVGE